MNNSKNVAVVGLAGLSVEASVGLDEVISVFISRYEDQQIADRQTIQASMIAINKDIKDVVEDVTEKVRSVVAGYAMNADNGIVVTTVELAERDAIQLCWDKGVATISLTSKIKSKTVSGYSGEVSGTVKIELPIDGADVDRYKQLMADKAKMTDQLNQVQTNLRDVSRKERQVRGKLAQMKLAEAGMSDLLNDAGLLALVDESVLNG